jgi:hypothetical protein
MLDTRGDEPGFQFKAKTIRVGEIVDRNMIEGDIQRAGVHRSANREYGRRQSLPVEFGHFSSAESLCECRKSFEKVAEASASSHK